MTMTGKMFWFANKVGIFSKVGATLHSLLSLAALVPFGYDCIPNINIWKDVVGVGFVYLIIVVYIASVINIILPIWSTRSVYHGFIKFLPADKLPNPKYLWLMVPGVVMPLIGILFSEGPGTFVTDASIQDRPKTLIIVPSVCYLFLITPAVLNLLVLGTPCAFIDELATYCIAGQENYELQVQQLVKNFKSFQDSVSGHLFVVYSLTTVQLILNLYSVLMNVCRNYQVDYTILLIVWILGLTCLLAFLGATLTNTYDNVLDVEETLRQALKVSKPVEKRQLLESQIHDIQSCQPFTALGFYSIDRSTLTATLGTTLTYCIILFQTVTC